MPNIADKQAREPLFQRLAFLLILVAISAGFLYMVWSFVMPLLMAAAFTGLTYPLYERLLRLLRKPQLAALASLLIFIIVIVIPVAAVITVAYHEAWIFFGTANFDALPGMLEKSLQQVQSRFPGIFSKWNSQNASQMTAQGIQAALQWALKNGAGWSLAAARNVASIFLMLFMMFYFYLDGRRILGKIMLWSPLRDDFHETLIKNFLAVSRATLKGILVMGAVQGTIGAILFWSVGLHSPVFLGVLMLFCSVIPAVGTGLVWVPAAIYLLIQGHIGGGIAVLLVGTLIIGTVDNFLRPRLIGKDIQMHDLMVLLSTLGGLEIFGLSGFVMGPILASLFLSIWTMYEEVFASELEYNHVAEKKSPE